MSDAVQKAAKPLLQARGLTKRFDGVTALEDFDLDVAAGEIIGLIGPNGAGKTTLFNILTGFLRADAGTVYINGQRLDRCPPHRVIGHGLARTFQGLRLIGGITARDNVMLACPGQAGENLLRLALAPRHVARQERANRDLAMACLDRVGLAHKAGDLAGRLSYGQQKLLTLACVLATDAQVLLLDEPVAGVHPRIIELILAELVALATEGKAVIVIEHNMRAIERIAHRIVFLDQGRKVAEGPPSEVLDNALVLEAYIG